VTNSFCPRPSWFRPAGNVLWARFDAVGPGFTVPHLRGRRGDGIRYEWKVHGYLARLFPGKVCHAPWIRFHSEGQRLRWAQPDVLLIDILAGRIVVGEVKHTHTSDAWYQLEHLYKPLLRTIFPENLWRIDLLEIVRWYDPATLFPCPIVLTNDPFNVPLGRFGVHIIGRKELNYGEAAKEKGWKEDASDAGVLMSSF